MFWGQFTEAAAGSADPDIPLLILCNGVYDTAFKGIWRLSVVGVAGEGFAFGVEFIEACAVGADPDEPVFIFEKDIHLV